MQNLFDSLNNLHSLLHFCWFKINLARYSTNVAVLNAVTNKMASANSTETYQVTDEISKNPFSVSL